MESRQFATSLTLAAGALVSLGALALVLSPFLGPSFSSSLWQIEPLAYIGGLLVIAGLGAFFIVGYGLPKLRARNSDGSTAGNWHQVTREHFALFQHDLGRPLARIVGKERELRAVLNAIDATPSADNTAALASASGLVNSLLSEIEMQAPAFRLMMANIEVLVQLESPDWRANSSAVEPAAILRRIVDRYLAVANEGQKRVTWWAEPHEFGIVHADAPALEHVVTNLVDNAVRHAASQVEVRITRNPTHFFIRVWDDGEGIDEHYLPHLFDRGWTTAASRAEEPSSSGLGLFIAKTIATRCGGDLTVETTASPNQDSHTAFLLSLPVGRPG